MPVRANWTLVTVGYGGRRLDEVVSSLVAHHVSCVVDVRAVPDSTSEGFSGAELSERLAGTGIDYVHLGALGDFQPETYEEYMATPAWAAEFERLRTLAARGTVALLCRCPEVERCHRRLIAGRLAADGFRVVHLTAAPAHRTVTLD